jgi:hypothetical protein
MLVHGTGITISTLCLEKSLFDDQQVVMLMLKDCQFHANETATSSRRGEASKHGPINFVHACNHMQLLPALTPSPNCRMEYINMFVLYFPVCSPHFLTRNMKPLAVSIALFGALDHIAGKPLDNTPCDPTATIDGGTIVGTTTCLAGTTVNQFFGIPFAAAPTGVQRFSPPKPTTWSKPLDTKAFKPACIQVFSPFESRDFVQDIFSVPRPAESEDCLYLNVWAPDKRPKQEGEGYPVLYWMYGGGFKFGNAGQPIYDGSHFAALEDVRITFDPMPSQDGRISSRL